MATGVCRAAHLPYSNWVRSAQPEEVPEPFHMAR